MSRGLWAGKIKAVALVAMAAVLCLGLIGCGGKSDEEAIREAVTKEFEALKTLDMDTINESLGSVSQVAQLEMLGIDTTEYLKACFGGFDYVVDDVTVDGNTATVKATLTAKPFMDAMMMDQEQITEDLYAGYIESGEMSSQDDIYTMVGTYLMDTINNLEPKTTQVELTYDKTNNVWTPSAAYGTALLAAFSSDTAAE